MKKGIEIEGELTEHGSCAHVLAVQSAIEGLTLKAYIKKVLKEKSDEIKANELKEIEAYVKDSKKQSSL